MFQANVFYKYHAGVLLCYLVGAAVRAEPVTARHLGKGEISRVTAGGRAGQLAALGLARRPGQGVGAARLQGAQLRQAHLYTTLLHPMVLAVHHSHAVRTLLDS